MLQQLTGILIAILVVLTVRHTFTYTKSKRNVRRGTQPNIFYLRSHFSLHHQLTHLIKLWIFPFRTYTPKKRMKNILLKCWYTVERYNHIRTQTEWKEKSCHSLQMSLFQNIFSIVESIIHLKLCRPVLIQFSITLKAFGTMRTSHTLMHHIRCTFSLSFYSSLSSLTPLPISLSVCPLCWFACLQQKCWLEWLSYTCCTVFRYQFVGAEFHNFYYMRMNVYTKCCFCLFWNNVFDLISPTDKFFCIRLYSVVLLCVSFNCFRWDFCRCCIPHRPFFRSDVCMSVSFRFLIVVLGSPLCDT